jgi:signal transduction histidine kinase
MKGPAQKQRKTGWIVARGIALVTLGFCLSYALSYGGIALIRGKAANASAGFWYSFLTFIIATVLFLGVASFIGRFILGGQRQNIFTTLTDAMRRIAVGDFDVTVPVDSHDAKSPMSEVAGSLNEMVESLKRMETMRQEFVSDVSHEIQSPLTSIAGFAQALHDEQLGVDQRHHYLDIIEEESKRLSRLSDNLLKLSALDSRAQPVQRGVYRLDAQLRSVILSSEPQWLQKRIEVAAELDPLTIEADEAMLHQVWSNLMHNAIKFTPDAGRITISCRRSEAGALVTVADSGNGIDAVDLPYLFDRFYKADKSRSIHKGAGGSGLGLSIVQKIVALHDGTVKAESGGIGRGSVFSVWLP